MQFAFMTYGMVLYNERQYTDKTLTLRKSMYMRASLETFRNSHVHILITAIYFNSVLVLQILCRTYKHVYTNLL